MNNDNCDYRVFRVMEFRFSLLGWLAVVVINYLVQVFLFRPMGHLDYYKGLPLLILTTFLMGAYVGYYFFRPPLITTKMEGIQIRLGINRVCRIPWANLESVGQVSFEDAINHPDFLGQLAIRTQTVSLAAKGEYGSIVIDDNKIIIDLNMNSDQIADVVSRIENSIHSARTN